MEASPPTATDERLDRNTILALVAMGIAVLVMAIDFTSLSVALPAIEKQFDTDVSTVQWVINAYALVFGVLIVTGGRLADMFGRKRIFVIGAVIFATFSLLGGLAQNTAWLIAARALMGIGGAMMWPAVLGMTFAALPANKAGLAGARRARSRDRALRGRGPGRPGYLVGARRREGRVVQGPRRQHAVGHRAIGRRDCS